MALAFLWRQTTSTAFIRILSKTIVYKDTYQQITKTSKGLVRVQQSHVEQPSLDNRSRPLLAPRRQSTLLLTVEPTSVVPTICNAGPTGSDIIYVSRFKTM